MEEENIKILTLYMGAWFWRIIGFIFFGFSVLFFTSNDMVFFISFFAIFFLCEFFAWKRAQEFRELNNKFMENEITNNPID